MAKTTNSERPADIVVVGGAGHVGFPLSLSFAATGRKVLILDKDLAALDLIGAGKLPFMEAGATAILKKAQKRHLLQLTSDPTSLPSTSSIVLTIGTPIDEFFNPQHQPIMDCIDSILPNLTTGQLLVLRSTVYPGTTDWLNRYIRQQGKKLRVAFCPERVVQGSAIKELKTFPQLVSGIDASSERAAAKLFSEVSPSIVFMKVLEAEFGKLFSNAYRYIEFAAANQLFMIANSAGVDFHEIRRGITQGYDRLKSFPSAGFAAGPCLFKDTMQLAAFAKNQFSIGHDAMLINEGLVLYVIEELQHQVKDLSKATVGLLGMAFKAESDDTRASLSYKLKNSLKFHCKEVLCTDPYVTTDTDLLSMSDVTSRSDVLVLCTPHKIYQELSRDDFKIIDIWGALGPR